MTGRPRVVKTYDPPPAADRARYLDALTYRAAREAKALRLRRWWLALVVLSLGWAALLTWDNLRLADRLVEVARHKPVYRLDSGLDGHQRLVLLDDTLTVTKGVRINAVGWFVRWSRQIGTDPVALARDRMAARERLVAGAERKWDALVAADLRPADGWTCDVTDLRIKERERDDARRLSSFHVVWTETVYKDFRLQGRRLMSAAVVTLDGPPRDGALDGVAISGFSEPTGTPLQPAPVAAEAGR